MKVFIRRLVAVVILFLAVGPAHVSAQEELRPNIILILVDDLGWSHLSSRMDERNPASASDYYETPNIDRLIRQGMRFTRGYASASICSPSRRSILYGQTPARLGDETFADKYGPRQTKHLSIPQVLKSVDNRYRAAHYGKWDMRAGFFPEDVGYDESDGDTGNRHGSVFTEKDNKWTTHFMHGDPKLVFSLAARAMNFMQRQTESGNPFYLQVSHYATHVDIQVRPETYEMYKTKTPGRKHRNVGFAAMLYDLDESIGQIMGKIDSLGINDRTYIFFMSDNGATEAIPPVRNRLDHPSAFSQPMRNSPLRGGKWTLYEGGIRVPFIVKGPGVQPHSQCDVPVAGWDLLPTFCHLAGNARVPGVLDGGSFVDLLKNGGKGLMKRPTSDLIFHRYHDGYPHSALISGDWKVLKFWKTGKVELFNVKDDVGEAKDISSEDPVRTRELAERLGRYLNEVNPGLQSSYK